MKRNKVRYRANPVPMIPIVLTGTLFLQYRDDEESAQGVKGDLLVYPQNEQLHTTRQGDYESTGFSGYFKIDVSDGRDWRPVLLNDIFPGKENHFSRSERPIDTFGLCETILRALSGRRVLRIYREHYELEAVE